MNRSDRHTLIACLTMLLLGTIAFAVDVPAAVILVPGDQPTIQQAIDQAAPGDLILVSPGTYGENVDFKGKAVTLRSDGDGLEVTHDPRPKETIIDAMKTGSGVIFVNKEGPGSVLEGFTVTNGSGTPMGNITYGGGIHLLDGASPTIRGNIVTENLANGGGGISCKDHCSPVLEYNEVSFNESVGSGGGIRCYERCDALIRGNRVFGNKAGSKGAGMFIAYSSPRIEDNRVTDNEAPTGTGIFCGWSYSMVYVDRNFIARNKATFGVSGGLACDATIMTARNNLIVENEAVNAGGGLLRLGEARLSPQHGGEQQGPELGGRDVVTLIRTRDPELRDPRQRGETGRERAHPPGRSDYRALPGGRGDFRARAILTGIRVSPMRRRGTITCSTVRPVEMPAPWVWPDAPADDREGDPRDGAPDLGEDEVHPHLYVMGVARPGESVEVNVTGPPKTAPILLFVSTVILETPKYTPLGVPGT